MGCACKKNLNPKYMDEDGKVDGQTRKTSGVMKIINAMSQLAFGLVVSAILIIGLIPALLIIMYHVCTGKEMNARIPNIQKFLKKK